MKISKLFMVILLVHLTLSACSGQSTNPPQKFPTPTPQKVFVPTPDKRTEIEGQLNIEAALSSVPTRPFDFGKVNDKIDKTYLNGQVQQKLVATGRAVYYGQINNYQGFSYTIHQGSNSLCMFALPEQLEFRDTTKNQILMLDQLRINQGIAEYGIKSSNQVLLDMLAAVDVTGLPKSWACVSTIVTNINDPDFLAIQVFLFDQTTGELKSWMPVAFLPQDNLSFEFAAGGRPDVKVNKSLLAWQSWNNTTSLMASPTPPLSEVTWFPALGASDLLNNGLWQCVPGMSRGVISWIMESPNNDLSVTNLMGPHFTITNNVRFQATERILSGSGGISYIADPASNSTTRRIDIGVSIGVPVVRIWTGDASNPSIFSLQSVKNATDSTLTMERVGDEWIFLNGDTEITRLPFSSFDGSSIGLGAYVTAGSQLNISSWNASVASILNPGLSITSPTVDVRTLPDNLPLRCYAHARGILIGAALNEESTLARNDKYLSWASDQFDIMTPAYALVLPATEAKQGIFNFGWANTIISESMKYNFLIRGHSLVGTTIGGTDLPDWIKQKTYTRNEMIEILHQFISTEMSLYKGKIPIWDVVNEAVDPSEPDGLAHNIFYQSIGPDYIDMAFIWAHETDPNALLFYNDYAAEESGRKFDLVYNLVKSMKDRGIPINGVGMQMHVSVCPRYWCMPALPKLDDVSANIKRLGNLGLQVQITEMDVSTNSFYGSMQNRLTQQAVVYADMLRACLQNTNCTAFIVWTPSDGDVHDQQSDPIGIVDENYLPKPAYYALRAVLRETP